MKRKIKDEKQHETNKQSNIYVVLYKFKDLKIECCADVLLLVKCMEIPALSKNTFVILILIRQCCIKVMSILIQGEKKEKLNRICLVKKIHF